MTPSSRRCFVRSRAPKVGRVQVGKQFGDRGPGGEGRAGEGSCALTSEKSGDALLKASVMRSLRWFAGAYFVEEL